MNAKKVLAMVLAIVLLMTATIAGTIAWLTAQTLEVNNTFTVGNIALDLWETDYEGTSSQPTHYRDDFKIIPGSTEMKNPLVTVDPASESCYVFIQIQELNNYNPEYVTWAIAAGWTQLKVPTTKGDENYYVYYREYTADDPDDSGKYYVLEGNKVSYPDILTKEQIDLLYNPGDDGKVDISSVNTEAQPKLNFKAFAVQKENVDDAADAWAKIPESEHLGYEATSQPPNP